METQNRGIELALFLTLPATAAFIFAADADRARPVRAWRLHRRAIRSCAAGRCRAFSIGLPSYVLVKVLTPGFYARSDTRTPVRLAIYLGRRQSGRQSDPDPEPGPDRHGPCRAAARHRARLDGQRRSCSIGVLRQRGHFVADRQLKRRLPRLALAALIMGGVVYFLAPIADPYLTGSLIVRGTALAVLVGGGMAVYGLACFLTGAFALDDLKLLLKRRARESA